MPVGRLRPAGRLGELGKSGSDQQRRYCAGWRRIVKVPAGPCRLGNHRKEGLFKDLLLERPSLREEVPRLNSPRPIHARNSDNGGPKTVVSIGRNNVWPG